MLAVSVVHAAASGTQDAAQGAAVAGVDEWFIEVMCADEELLRAEFDAIVAEEWADSPPPTDPAPATAGVNRGPRGSGLPSRCLATPGQPHHRGADGWSRQRSPPGRTGLTGTHDEDRPQWMAAMDGRNGWTKGGDGLTPSTNSDEAESELSLAWAAFW
jgi:hypothetical protein